MQALLDDIAIDLVLSEHQVNKWYGLRLEELPELSPRGEILLLEALLPGRYSPQPQRFIAVRKLKKARWHTLRHLAGLATMRRLLQAKDGWTVQVRTGRDFPDAIWQQKAIEYDAGEYSRSTLRFKLGHYERNPKQIWGTVSASRRALISRLAAEMQIKNLENVLVAPWN